MKYVIFPVHYVPSTGIIKYGSQNEGDDMSRELNTLVNDLFSNVGAISRFFSNPKEMAEEYGVRGMELNALLSRDLDALNALGLSKTLAVGALSGGHSGTCSIIEFE
ncbi:MAG: hypothetical protein LBI63_04735 [Candidatus Ancillula sp.]|jgi:hypothetical protein|nr:hypothetical protein [Candidatus Ancillula sp.]